MYLPVFECMKPRMQEWPEQPQQPEQAKIRKFKVVIWMLGVHTSKTGPHVGH